MTHRFAKSLVALASLAAVAAAAQSGLAPRASAPSCSPTSSASYASSPGFTYTTGAPATFTDTITVSGLDAYLWDVDATVNLTHTAGTDIDILLRSPAGTQIALTTNNGASNDNTFAGTLFDGQVNDPPTEHVYMMNVVATPLSPEGSFGAFRGENPNGVWSMIVRDELIGDGGTWHSWGIDLFTLPSAPAEISTTVSESPALAIPSPGSLVRTLNVTGLGTELTKVVLYTEIPHTYNADIDMTLTSPAGTVVLITSDNGYIYNNGFNGTTWDPDGTEAVTDHFFPGDGVQTPLTPEGPLTAFMGENPNGVWTLTVADDRTNDLGSLVRWDLTIHSCPGAPPVVYCSPLGPNAGGCTADISATDNPDVAHSNTCQISVTNVDDNRSGILFYSVTGSQSTPWCAVGGNSFLCVLFPTIRTGVQDSGGGVNPCDGVFFLDWNAYQLANPGLPGQPFSAGDKAWVQGWFRSTADCKTTFLSEAVELTYQP
jgi:subtilisin-like proprotein convertase family protein